jgi:hypothetical protein
VNDEQLSQLIHLNRSTVVKVRAALLSHFPPGWDVDFGYNAEARTVRLTPVPPKGSLLGDEEHGAFQDSEQHSRS